MAADSCWRVKPSASKNRGGPFRPFWNSYLEIWLWTVWRKPFGHNKVKQCKLAFY